MLISFSKYHGAGNDFIMIDNREKRFVPSVDIIKEMCKTHTGIGADGLILLEENAEGLLMRYFNSDGNESTMCGNGGRCFASFAFTLNLVPVKMKFWGIDSIHEAEILENGFVKLRMKDISKVETIDDGFFLDSGSPHFVSFVRNVNNVDVAREGNLIRQSVNVQNGGTNANFVQVESNGILKIRTFERGVEAETLACGTGAVASAIAYHEFFEPSDTKVTVKALGGTLKVSFSVIENKYSNIWLEGPVKHVFDGSFNIKHNSL